MKSFSCEAIWAFAMGMEIMKKSLNKAIKLFGQSIKQRIEPKYGIPSKCILNSYNRKCESSEERERE